MISCYPIWGAIRHIIKHGGAHRHTIHSMFRISRHTRYRHHLHHASHLVISKPAIIGYVCVAIGGGAWMGAPSEGGAAGAGYPEIGYPGGGYVDSGYPGAGYPGYEAGYGAGSFGPGNYMIPGSFGQGASPTISAGSAYLPPELVAGLPPGPRALPSLGIQPGNEIIAPQMPPGASEAEISPPLHPIEESPPHPPIHQPPPHHPVPEPSSFAQLLIALTALGIGWGAWLIRKAD